MAGEQPKEINVHGKTHNHTHLHIAPPYPPLLDPFVDRNANPFADPSVQGALASSRIYDDVDDGSSAYKGGAGWGAHQSSTGVDNLEYDGSRTPLGAAGSSSREEELQRRERELEQRERDLQQRANQIKKHGRNNWPFCKSALSPTASAKLILTAVFPRPLATRHCQSTPSS